MSLSTIRQSLKDQLSAIEGMPEIHDEDENFKPKSEDYPFIRFTMMPMEGSQQDLTSGKQIVKGLLRIDIFCSTSLNTTAPAREHADQIVAMMKPAKQVILSDCALRIESSWVETTRYEATTADVPVFVRWSSLAI